MRAKRLEMTSDQVSMGLKSAVWTPRAASIAKKTNPHVSGVAAPVEYFRSLLGPRHMRNQSTVDAHGNTVDVGTRVRV